MLPPLPKAVNGKLKSMTGMDPDPRAVLGLPGWIVTPLLVLFWYASNVGVVMLNKYLLSYYGFGFPVLLTMCHMAGSTILCVLCSLAGVIPRQSIQTLAQFSKVAFLSTIFASTVVLGNVSLRHIPVSFNQAIGATTPVFTAILSVVILGQRESLQTYLALIPVVGGILVATGFEPSFQMFGFIACITATSLRALKSIVQAALLDSSEKLDSMNLLMYMAPIALGVLFPVALILEPHAFAAAYDLAVGKPGFIMLLTLNCVAAFCANLLNFLVTKHTSALTLQVLGNAKGGVAAIVSILVFQNPVSTASCLGYLVATGGVVLYSRAKTAASKSRGGGKSGALPKTPYGGDDSGPASERAYLMERLSSARSNDLSAAGAATGNGRLGTALARASSPAASAHQPHADGRDC